MAQNDSGAVAPPRFSQSLEGMDTMMLTRIAFVALIFTAPVLADDGIEAAKRLATQNVESKEYKFLSWYNGWTRHDVWGIGAVQAAYSGGKVQCGKLIVPLVPIHDSHVPFPLTLEQSEDYAKAYNLTMLKLLKSQNIYCKFELIDEK